MNIYVKKSVPSGKPVEIIGDEDGDDGDDEEETQPVVKQTRKNFVKHFVYIGPLLIGDFS